MALAGTASDPMRDYNGSIENLGRLRDMVHKSARNNGEKIADLNHDAIAANQKKFADLTDDVAQMDFQKWIKLTIAGFQHQDPMNPKDPGSVTAEMANIGMAVGFSKIPKELAEVKALMNKSMSLSASNRIGQKVEAQFNTFKLTAGQETKLGFDLPVSADKVEVTIYNDKFEPVRKITLTEGEVRKVNGEDEITHLSLGRHDIAWDGLTNKGKEADAGKYTFQVRAFDKDNHLLKDPSSGENLTIRRYVQGTLEASFVDDKGANHAMVDGIEMPFDALKKFYAPPHKSSPEEVSKTPEPAHPMPNGPVYGPQTYAEHQKSQWQEDVNNLKQGFEKEASRTFTESDMPEGLADI